MIFTYCPDCGAKLEPREIGDEGRIPYCPHCARPWFSFSYPCVICAVYDGHGQVALIRQSELSDLYVCVAGYIKQQESIEAAAKREVEEETGLHVRKVTYLGSYPYPRRDQLMLAFAVLVDHDTFHLSKEVDAAKWFSEAEATSHVRSGSVAQHVIQACIDQQSHVG